MRLVLSFNGSRGDVQPGVALAVALTERGHDVVVAVPPNLVDFAASAGVTAHPCGLDTKALLGSDLVTQDLKSRNPRTRLRAISEVTLRGGRAAQAQLHALSEGADAIVGGSVGQERTLAVANATGVAYVPVHYCPMRANRQVSLLAQWGVHLPRPLTRASWTVVEQILWQTSRRGENALRADLGLESARTPTATRIVAQGVPEIQAYDPALFPGLREEWAERKPLIGFLNLTPATRALVGDAQGSSDIDEWLDAGPAPIYVGFGSMAVNDPTALAHMISQVTDELGQRVLVAAGWSDFMASNVDDRIKVVSTVDHDAVLPRCVAAVHHGGAGSTAASLRAGLPTVVCWLGADQPIWGDQVVRAGAGSSIALGRLTADSLRDALIHALAPERAAAAQVLAGRLITPGAAVASAVAIIETTVADHVGGAIE